MRACACDFARVQRLRGAGGAASGGRDAATFGAAALRVPPPPTPPLPYVPSIPLPTPANLQPTSRQLYGGVRVITGADLPCTSARKCSSVAEVGWRVLCACAEEQCLTLHWSLRGRRLTDSNMEVVSAAAAGRSVGLATLNLAGNELTDQSAATLAALQRR